jgi:hypothetical protein
MSATLAEGIACVLEKAGPRTPSAEQIRHDIADLLEALGMEPELFGAA